MQIAESQDASVPAPLSFLDHTTETVVLRYEQLKVWDSALRELPAQLEARLNGFSILVDDTEAAYPVTIDPLIISQEARLGPDFTGDGAPSDYFGYSVAVSSDTAIVGAYWDDTAAGDFAGSVYVFTRTGTVWSQQAKIIAPDAAAADYFGSSVALSGDTALIGAYADDTTFIADAGSAYVFVRNGTNWSQQAKLISGEPGSTDWFGTSVALYEHTATVGAHLDDTEGGVDAGSSYVFVRNGTNWTRQARLVPHDAAAGDYFGYSVAVAGDTVIVGAYRKDSPAGNDSGSAYVFQRVGTNWTQQAKLTAGDAAVFDSFGYDVAVLGDTALIGAFYDTTAAGTAAGSAYVFVRNGANWSQQAKLVPGDPRPGDRFGNSVALAGETAVIGTYLHDISGGTDTGGAYVFVRAGANWSQQAKLTSQAPTSFEQFGWSVAISGDTTVIGAPFGLNVGVGRSGHGTVFVREGTNWIRQGRLSAGESAAGDRFGGAVALSGETALIGADADATAAGIGAGSAYVFVRSDGIWRQEARLFSSDAAEHDHFGQSVALAGNTALISAYSDDVAGIAQAGSAYVFIRTGASWSQQAKLEASDKAVDDYFGNAVALSGDTALVGAASDDTSAGANAGSAYVFSRSNTVWTQQAKLLAADAVAADRFGDSVALSGNTAIVGAPYDNALMGGYAGSVYVFTRAGAVWRQQAKLSPIGEAQDALFGSSVALFNDTAVIGAQQGGGFTGTAYVFVRNGTNWQQQARLAASDGETVRFFGGSAAVLGDAALIGALGAAVNDQAFAGAAYLFVRSGTNWIQHAKLTADSPSPYDYLGGAVALSGDTALVGGFGDDAVHPVTHDPIADQGSVHVFRIIIPAPEISVEQPVGTVLIDDTSSIPFGTVRLGGSSAARSFLIRNIGTAPLNVTAINKSGGNPGDFVVSGIGLPVTVATNDDVTFSVTFSPAAGGSRGTTLQIVSDDGDEPTFDILLAGLANTAPALLGRR